jgi:hypothetical protein
VKNDDFGEDIVSKPYPEYKYQSVLKGPKIREKGAFLKAINRSNLDHLYGLNPLEKRSNYFFCPKKVILGAQKKQNSENTLLQETFQLNQPDLVKVVKREEPKRDRSRGKTI